MKITIPNKCQDYQDWNEMTPNEKGRFCQNCQKTVVDFTQMTDSQIKNYVLKNYGQRTCGRFKESQLNRDISTIPKKRSNILPKIAASALLFAGVNQFVESQIDINANKQEQHSNIEIAKSQKEANKTIIHGKITDHDSKKISNVKIYIDDLQISFYSEWNGDFSFEIPENYDKEEITLIFSALGYSDVKQTYTLAQIKQGALRILMSETLLENIVVTSVRFESQKMPMPTVGIMITNFVTPPNKLRHRVSRKIKRFCKTIINNNRFFK